MKTIYKIYFFKTILDKTIKNQISKHHHASFGLFKD